MQVTIAARRYRHDERKNSPDRSSGIPSITRRSWFPWSAAGRTLWTRGFAECQSLCPSPATVPSQDQ